MHEQSGIYQIKNRINANCYIGSAVNLAKRWRAHLRQLRRNMHYNEHLQRAFNKYGENSFVFSVLEHVEQRASLLKCEQHYLDTLKPEYNISPTAGSTLGFHHSRKTKRKFHKIAKARRRRVRATIGIFISECCILNTDAWTSSKDLWLAYKAWGMRTGIAPSRLLKYRAYRQQHRRRYAGTFGAVLSRHNCHEGTHPAGKGILGWWGIRLACPLE